MTGDRWTVTAAELYEAWKWWCTRNGVEPGTAQQFGMKLRLAVPGVSKAKQGPAAGRHTVYTGVAARGVE